MSLACVVDAPLGGLGWHEVVGAFEYLDGRVFCAVWQSRYLMQGLVCLMLDTQVPASYTPGSHSAYDQ